MAVPHSSPAGEWEGITATFYPSGQPQTLPDLYVPRVGPSMFYWVVNTASLSPPHTHARARTRTHPPQAFTDWGVQLFDWQTTHSFLAEPVWPTGASDPPPVLSVVRTHVHSRDGFAC